MRASRPLVIPAMDPGALEGAEATLRSGGVVGIPTETVYGLAVLPLAAPLQALLAAKERSPDKGIAVLIDGLDQLAGLVEVSGPARRLAEELWPGALTLVLPLRSEDLVPATLSGGTGSLGLRLPDHIVPRTLARRLGPLAVSSANRSGQPPAITATELVAAVGESLALVIDDGPVRGGVASTVVAVDADGSYRILRQGAIERRRIEAVAAGAA